MRLSQTLIETPPTTPDITKLFSYMIMFVPMLGHQLKPGGIATFGTSILPPYSPDIDPSDN